MDYATVYFIKTIIKVLLTKARAPCQLKMQEKSDGSHGIGVVNALCGYIYGFLQNTDNDLLKIIIPLFTLTCLFTSRSLPHYREAFQTFPGLVKTVSVYYRPSFYGILFQILPQTPHTSLNANYREMLVTKSY